MALCSAGLSRLCLHTGLCRTPIPSTHNLNPSVCSPAHCSSLSLPIKWVWKQPPSNTPIFHLCCFLHVWFAPASSHPVHIKCSFPAAIPFTGSYTTSAQQSAHWEPWKKGVVVAFYPKSECRSQLCLVDTERAFLQCIGQ